MRDEEIKKNDGAIDKYITKKEEILLINPVPEQKKELQISENVKEMLEKIDDNDSISYDKSENENVSDPGTWPEVITDSLRVKIVKKGPIKSSKNFKYPMDTLNRRFPVSVLNKTLRNGEVNERTWLIYSVSKDVVYCFCCKLFSCTNSALTKFGCNDWKNVHNIIKEHETSKIHFHSLKMLMELSVRLSTIKTIDAAHQRALNIETQHWQNVLERLFAIVEFLSQQCLSFRGKVE